MKQKPKKYVKQKSTKLHIGCGRKKLDGFINIDISKEVNPDIIVNIEEGLPFEDNSFSYIYSKNALEEIRPQHWDFVLREISRISKNDCILELDLNFDNLYQRTRVNHYRTFSWDSFYCFEEGQETLYSAPIILRNLKERPNILVRLWFYFFPFLKQNVQFKFKIIKK